LVISPAVNYSSARELAEAFAETFRSRRKSATEDEARITAIEYWSRIEETGAPLMMVLSRHAMCPECQSLKKVFRMKPDEVICWECSAKETIQ
jgi:hypothetical protein